MLRSVRAFHIESLRAVYECRRCGKLNMPQSLTLIPPSMCSSCGARFQYIWDITGPGIQAYFGNASDTVQRIPTDQQPVMADGPIVHGPFYGLVNTQDIGPTTACFDCGAIIPVGDAYYTSKRDERALCERCYGKAEKAGRAKCRN